MTVATTGLLRAADAREGDVRITRIVAFDLHCKRNQVAGKNARLDVVFRVQPGPGNYVTIGDPASGLRRLPTAPAAITSNDASFWTSYINNNGAFGTPGGHPAGPHALRWTRRRRSCSACRTCSVRG